MTDTLLIALAQINPTVGDIDGNLARIRHAREEAARMGAELVVFPELSVCGYPPEDLVLKPFFQDRVEAATRHLATETADGGPALLVGAPWREDGRLYNAALLLDGGAIAAVRYKHDLPNYGVFDEKRVFAAGPLPAPLPFRGASLGVMICEDMWTPAVAASLKESGAALLLVLNGSPFETDKRHERMNWAVARVGEVGLPLVYVNQVCGQDELVFDGASFVLGADRALRVQMPAWREEVATVRWRAGEAGPDSGSGPDCEPGEMAKLPEELEAVWQAMVLGLRDYVGKNGFPGVLLGLSGGIDSALSAAVAVDALGADRVHAVMMPSPFTSQESLEDAAGVAAMLGIHCDTISIEPAMAAFGGMLEASFAGTEPGIAEENIQARSRGLVLMALSNRLGHMVLSTGNKSEMSVGYATLYGDMCGGYSVLKDVYKTMVFALAHWRNETRPDAARGPDGPVMPQRVIDKPPSAELRPDQKDEDSLPPYDKLDDILYCLIEAEMGIDEIIARGHDGALVQRVWRMVDLAEYKRRQAPPGVKITSRAFGRDRRYPITNAFRSLS